MSCADIFNVRGCRVPPLRLRVHNVTKADVPALGDSTPTVDGKAIRGFAIVPFTPVSPLCRFLLVRHAQPRFWANRTALRA